jgi:hypothetical protein
VCGAPGETRFCAELASVAACARLSACADERQATRSSCLSRTSPVPLHTRARAHASLTPAHDAPQLQRRGVRARLTRIGGCMTHHTLPDGTPALQQRRDGPAAGHSTNGTGE